MSTKKNTSVNIQAVQYYVPFHTAWLKKIRRVDENADIISLPGP